ncbi:unnamed protein product, partial [Brenthis ino]
MVHCPTLLTSALTWAWLNITVAAYYLHVFIFICVLISVAQLYTPYILGYGTPGLSGGKAWTLYECVDCGNKYKHKGSLQRHIKYECRKQPSFKCPYCVYRAYQKHNLLLHERHLHKDLPEKVDFVSE